MFKLLGFLSKIKDLKVMDIPKAIVGYVLNKIAGTKTWFLLRLLSRIVIDGTEYDIFGKAGNFFEAKTKTGGEVKFDRNDIKKVVKSTLSKKAEEIMLLGEAVKLTGIKVNISKDTFIPLKSSDLVKTHGKFLKLVFTTVNK